MSFARDHLIGIILGVILYEMYWRMRAAPRPGGP